MPLFMSESLIAVLPKNLRSIALHAIAIAAEPVVLMDLSPISNFSEHGPLTKTGIRACRDFEIRDASKPILGFHDHPSEMWIAASHAEFAGHCAKQGWLKIQHGAA